MKATVSRRKVYAIECMYIYICIALNPSSMQKKTKMKKERVNFHYVVKIAYNVV